MHFEDSGLILGLSSALLEPSEGFLGPSWALLGHLLRFCSICWAHGGKMGALHYITFCCPPKRPPGELLAATQTDTSLTLSTRFPPHYITYTCIHVYMQYMHPRKAPRGLPQRAPTKQHQNILAFRPVFFKYVMYVMYVM